MWIEADLPVKYAVQTAQTRQCLEDASLRHNEEYSFFSVCKGKCTASIDKDHDIMVITFSPRVGVSSSSGR